MEQVDQEAFSGLQADAVFTLQLRPSAPPQADPESLAKQIDQFVGLYLGGSQVENGRFSHLAPLTWVIGAPRSEIGVLQDVRADLAETLFGRASGEEVRLLRQDEDPSLEPEAPVSETAADAGEALSASWEPAHSSAATRAAMDDASDILDLDSPMLDIVDGEVLEVDDWTLETPPVADPATAELAEPAAPDPAEEEAPRADDPEPDSSFDTLIEPPERPASVNIAAELSAFRLEMREIASRIPSAGADTAIEQFRAELDTITGALGQRVDGAAQRIESAADRVAASIAGFPDAERIAGAVARVEESALHMETSVRESVQALEAALKAMSQGKGEELGEADSGA